MWYIPICSCTNCTAHWLFLIPKQDIKAGSQQPCLVWLNLKRLPPWCGSFGLCESWIWTLVQFLSSSKQYTAVCVNSFIPYLFYFIAQCKVKLLYAIFFILLYILYFHVYCLVLYRDMWEKQDFNLYVLYIWQFWLNFTGCNLFFFSSCFGELLSILAHRS